VGALAENLLCYNLFAPLVDCRDWGLPGSFLNMLSGKKKLQIVAAFATLLLFAVGVGCKGFFVDPTLTGLAVGPQATISQNTTVQMTAVGTYNDGTQKPLSTGIFWSSSATNIASINTSGLVTGISPGQTTINAGAGTVSGSATVTVTITGLTAIKVTPANIALNGGASQQYTATGTVNGKPEDLTTIATWATSDTSGLVSIDNTGLVTVNSISGTPQTQVQISATEGTVVGTTILTVNAQP
jgi:trimeric autotransporter adhesin